MAIAGEMTALEVADRFAAQLNGVDYQVIEDLRRPSVNTDLAPIEYGEYHAPVMLAHCGSEGDIIKGGGRAWTYATLEASKASVGALGYGMDAKITYCDITDQTTGRPIRGAKLLIARSMDGLNQTGRNEVAYQTERSLEGIMSPFGYIPAGDAGTNAAFCDALSVSYLTNHPEDKYGLAAVTGKSPTQGGLGPRSAATGRGGYAAHVAHTDVLIGEGVLEDRPQRVSMQGGGNVAAWHGNAISEDPNDRARVQNIGEHDGVLYTDDPHGIEFTDRMIREVADNPGFRGSKLEAYHHLIQLNQPGLKLHYTPDAEAIYARPADAFVTAAVGTLLVAKRIKSLHEAGVRNIEEEGNTATSQAGQEAADALGIRINPDIAVNNGGVWMSLKEREVNIAMADGTLTMPPSDEVLNAELTDFMASSNHTTMKIARQYNVSARVAACIVSQRNLLKHAGVAVTI